MGDCDCEVCDDGKKEVCPIVGVYKFVEEHEDELKVFLEPTAKYGASVLRIAIQENPKVLGVVDDMISLSKKMAVFGYVKGRLYKPVPKVFEEA